MGKQVCAKHNEAYETECKWCEPDNEGASGPYTPVNPLVGRTASELQRLMNEAWVKMARLEKDAKAAAVIEPSTLTVECYPGCPLCRKENP